MNEMQTIPAMVSELREHAACPWADPNSKDLYQAAATFIEGAAESLREHMAMVTALRVKVEQTRTLMEQAADELAENASDAYPHRDAYPDEMRRYMRDMELPRAIWSMLRRPQ
jgi:nitrogen fixation/metabolism regulation signal transduction histidine kinase